MTGLYTGYRDPLPRAFVWRRGGSRVPLPDASGTRYEWGYLGGGPNNLARSILADYLGRDAGRITNGCVIDFAVSFLEQLPAGPGSGLGAWVVTGTEVDRWVADRAALYPELRQEARR